jgi:glycosyltransferase involved in cell wall biosynthesis
LDGSDKEGYWMKGTLLIISHTEHGTDASGRIVGLPSTVEEIDQLGKIFDRIIHIACWHKSGNTVGMRPYKSPGIEFIPIPPYGGSGWKKLSVIWTAPWIIYVVFSNLRRSSCFHFRAPTAMGVYLIPLLTLFTTKKGWFKYAGNWVHPQPPLSYRWQRFFLKHWQQRKVTVNGKWPDSLPHIQAFENPCLHQYNVLASKQFVSQKYFEPPFEFCFVGRLDKSKGFDVAVAALLKFDPRYIKHIWVVGELVEKDKWTARTQGLPLSFLGFLDRDEVLKYLIRSNFLLLPTQSEGFPKVVAEGWSVGCLPIVTDVSSIGQYVMNNINGFTFNLQQRNPDDLANLLFSLKGNIDFKAMVKRGYEQAQLFTFEKYLQRVSDEILVPT